MMRYLSVISLSFAAALPAFAHVGDHSFIRSSADAIWHLLEPDHIVFAVATVIVGIAAYRAGRRAEARVHVNKDKPHDPR
jgi:hydrogenase/urease accessory protein HupE